MISIERRDKVDIISFQLDKINALITDELRDQIGKVFENANSRVIVDLKGIKYIDSSGFGCFLSILRTAKNNYGILKFVNPEPSVMQVIQTLNLQTVLEIYDDIDVCMRTLR